jgi:hypothetical protein
VAELRDGRELQSLEAEGFGAADVLDFVVEEESFVGADAELVAGELVDGGVGLGDAELAGPGELVEVCKPGEFPKHGAEDLGNHVGENSGEEAGVLECGGPCEHGRVEGCPHENVNGDEFADLRRREGAAGVAREFRPVCGAVEMAKVVVAAIAPVETFEGVAVEPGEGDEALVRGSVLGAEDFTVVEDDGADCGHAEFIIGDLVRLMTSPCEKMRACDFRRGQRGMWQRRGLRAQCGSGGLRGWRFWI